VLFLQHANPVVQSSQSPLWKSNGMTSYPVTPVEEDYMSDSSTASSFARGSRARSSLPIIRHLTTRHVGESYILLTPLDTWVSHTFYLHHQTRGWVIHSTYTTRHVGESYSLLTPPDTWVSHTFYLHHQTRGWVIQSAYTTRHVVSHTVYLLGSLLSST